MAVSVISGELKTVELEWLRAIAGPTSIRPTANAALIKEVRFIRTPLLLSIYTLILALLFRPKPAIYRISHLLLCLENLFKACLLPFKSCWALWR